MGYSGKVLSDIGLQVVSQREETPRWFIPQQHLCACPAPLDSLKMNMPPPRDPGVLHKEQLSLITDLCKRNYIHLTDGSEEAEGLNNLPEDTMMTQPGG